MFSTTFKGCFLPTNMNNSEQNTFGYASTKDIFNGGLLHPKREGLPVSGQTYLNYDTGRYDGIGNNYYGNSFSGYSDDLRMDPNIINKRRGNNSLEQAQAQAHAPPQMHTNIKDLQQPPQRNTVNMAENNSSRQEPRNTAAFQILNKNAVKPPQTVFDINNYFECPSCKQLATSTCNCRYRDAKCINGHTWFINEQNKKQLGVSPSHS